MIVDLLIKFCADYLIFVIVIIAGIAMLRVPRRYQSIARGVVMGLVALLLARIAGLFYQDAARPFELLGVQAKAAYLHNAGFPSDHMLFVAAITIVVWASTKNAKLAVTLVILSVLVGLGRVLALVHSPQDVIGGAACAMLAGFIVYGARLWTKRLPDT